MEILKATFSDEFPKLMTNRFLLREVTENDIHEIYSIYSNKEAVRFQQIEPMSNLTQAKKAVNYFKSAYKDKKFIRWCITYKGSDKVIGLITLHSFDNWNAKAEIGYMLNQKYWNQGIMSEVGKRIIQYAFLTSKLHRIEALVDPLNFPANKLSLKLAFQREGLKKDAAFNKRTKNFEDRVIYGLLNDNNKIAEEH